MRDYRRCPARTVVDAAEGREEFAQCEVLKAHLGWYAQVGASVCRQCAEAGEAVKTNPKLHATLTHLMKLRVFDVENPHYPVERTPQALLRELSAEGRIRDRNAALELLDEAVRRGMTPAEAARIATEEGLDADRAL